jgi:TonB family protein
MASFYLITLALLQGSLTGSPPTTTKDTANTANISFDTQPKPASNPGSWATWADYPAEALRQLKEGVVRFELTINKQGTVSECRVTGSSGSPELDVTTCRLLSARGRFEPARDSTGAAVIGKWSSSVRWQIPRAARVPPAAGTAVMTFRVGADGKVDECQFESATGSTSSLLANAGSICPTSFISGYTDAEGKPVARRVRTTIEIEILAE